MDGKPESGGRSVTRRFEGSRIEDEIWAVAFGQIWPLLREAMQRVPPTPLKEPQKASRGKAISARRA